MHLLVNLFWQFLVFLYRTQAHLICLSHVPPSTETSICANPSLQFTFPHGRIDSLVSAYVMHLFLPRARRSIVQNSTSGRKAIQCYRVKVVAFEFRIYIDTNTTFGKWNFFGGMLQDLGWSTDDFLRSLALLERKVSQYYVKPF